MGSIPTRPTHIERRLEPVRTRLGPLIEIHAAPFAVALLSAEEETGNGAVEALDRRGGSMGKYLVRGNYVGDGAKGLLEDGGTRRREAGVAAVESVGGSLDCMYYAFGDTDVYAICDFPDDASATAVSLLINSSGSLSVNLTPLMTPEDIDAAAEKSPTYRPPGA